MTTRKRHKRHGQRATVSTVTADSMEEFYRARDAERQNMGVPDVDVEAVARRIVQEMPAKLEEMGLPDTPIVSFDPDTLEVLDGGEAARRHVNGGRVAEGALTVYLHRRGFGQWDRPTMMARGLRDAAIILDEALGEGDRLNAAWRLGADMVRQQVFSRGDRQIMDAAEHARGRNAWARDLAGEMVKADPSASARALFETIPEKVEAEVDPESGLEIYRDSEKLVAIEDATGEVSEISFESWRRYVRAEKNQKK